MAIEHKNITDAERHEPKGASTAAIGSVYYSDGATSGDWKRYEGWGEYEDTDLTVGSPSQNIATGVRTQFTCDGGSLTIQKLPEDAVTALWNTSTNKHIPVALYDIHLLRVTFTAANYAGATPYIEIELDIGGSVGVIYTNTQPLLKAGVAQAISVVIPVHVDATYLSNGGTVYLTYVGTGTCDIYKSSVLVIRESKNFV